MAKFILLFCILLVLSHIAYAASCYTTYVSVTLNSTEVGGTFDCPIGKRPSSTKGFTTCQNFEYPGSYPCSFRSGININAISKCVGKTRFESTGDECEVSEQCVFSKISSPFGSVCVNGKCVAKGASKTIPIGSSCVYPNYNYVFDVCVSGAVCFGGTCTKKEQNDGSILCSRDEPCTNGQTCLFVYGKAGTCGTPLKDGEKCDHRAYCLPDRACRKSKESDSEKTCRPIAKMGEYCADQFDCVGGFEIPTTLSRCVKNVCTRKYGAKNGESCSTSENCYSGYCEAGVCKDFYANPKDCTSCDGICSCGGEKLVKDYAGKCIDACNGPKTDAEMCMFNMGAAYVAGAFNEFSLVPGFSIYQWYDEKSSLFTNCKTYFQRYYSCAKSRLEAAGIVGFPSTFGGMSLDNYKEGEPLMPIQPSSSYTPPGDKASSAIMLMSGSFKLFLVIVAVLGFLMM